MFMNALSTSTAEIATIEVINFCLRPPKSTRDIHNGRVSSSPASICDTCDEAQIERRQEPAAAENDRFNQIHDLEHIAPASTSPARRVTPAHHPVPKVCNLSGP